MQIVCRAPGVSSALPCFPRFGFSQSPQSSCFVGKHNLSQPSTYSAFVNWQPSHYWCWAGITCNCSSMHSPAGNEQNTTDNVRLSNNFHPHISPSIHQLECMHKKLHELSPSATLCALLRPTTSDTTKRTKIPNKSINKNKCTHFIKTKEKTNATDSTHYTDTSDDASNNQNENQSRDPGRKV